MNKIELDRLLKPLISIYDDIELDLIKNIIEIIDNYDGVKGSLEWYLDKLNDVGMLEKENLSSFKNNKDAIKDELKRILNDSGHKIDNFDKVQKYYKDGLIEINPLSLYESNSINNLIGNALKDCKDITSLIQTKAIEGAEKTYIDVLNKAYVETASGVYTYTESIRRALKEYATKGIEAAHYESGKTLSIEAVVRRDIITRVNKLTGDVQIQSAKELGTNLVYVDQHLGARIRTPYMQNDYEAHAEWQGKKYSIDGDTKEYPNLHKVTGYGEMLGLKGINCYHNMRPTWEWEDIPDVIDEVENKEAYEQLDKKREFERKIRILKRKKIIAKNTNDKEKLIKTNNKLNNMNSKYDNWLKENNLTRDYNREHIANKVKSTKLSSTNDTNKSTSLKSFVEKVKEEDKYTKLEEYNDIIRNSNYEISYVIQNNGNVWKFIGNDKSVNTKGINITDAIVTHNHPIDYDIYRTFGEDDFSYIKDNNIKELNVTCPEFDDKVIVVKKIDISYNEIYREAMKRCYENENLEIQREAMLILQEKGYVKYERRIRKIK